MTPPMTDAELLAYIERTPELAALFPDAARWLSPHAAPYANVARAFHAHEQRVREEEREACAKLIERRGELYVSKWMNADDMETQAKAYAWEARQHAIAIRALNGSTAPQLSTADQPACIDCAPEFACWGGRIACCKQPVLNSTEQGEAAEAVGLLQAVKKDLEDRAEDGVVELSSNVWQRLCDFLAKQGGK